MLFVLRLETATIKMKINFLPIADVLSRIKYLVSETLDWGGVDKFARILPAKMSSMSFSTNERPGLTTTDQSQAWKWKIVQLYLPALTHLTAGLGLPWT